MKGAKGDDFVAGDMGAGWIEGSEGVDTLRGGHEDVVLSEELVKGSTGRRHDFCEAAIPALTG